MVWGCNGIFWFEVGVFERGKRRRGRKRGMSVSVYVRVRYRSRVLYLSSLCPQSLETAK
jgi:hypothetical protein